MLPNSNAIAKVTTVPGFVSGLVVFVSHKMRSLEGESYARIASWWALRYSGFRVTIGPRDGSSLQVRESGPRRLWSVGLAGKLSGVMFSCHDRFLYSTVLLVRRLLI